MTKKGLDVVTIDLEKQQGIIVSSNKLENCTNFASSIISEIHSMSGIGSVLIDAGGLLENEKPNVSNYYKDNLDSVIDKLIEFIDKKITDGVPPKANLALIIFGVYKLIGKLEDTMKFESLIDKIKEYEKMPIILIDDQNKLKDYGYETWYNFFSQDIFLWVGKGMGDQSLFKYSNFDKEMNADIKTDYGYYIEEGTAELIKYIDFNAKEDDANE